jgi:hypothetical protein
VACREPVDLFGFAWFVTFLTDAHDAVLFTVGYAVQSVCLVGFAYLVVSFPSGRLTGRLRRPDFPVMCLAGETRVSLSSRAAACPGLLTARMCKVWVSGGG